MKINGRIAKKLTTLGLTAALVLAGAGTVSHFEGKSNKAYLDPVSIITICYGQTKDVKLGQYKTDDECLESLADELVTHNSKMMVSIKVPISVKEHAAYLSFVYNVGNSAFDRSTLLRKLNVGNKVGACAELLRWDKAGGKTLKGLTLRRQAENKLCLDGVKENEALKRQKESR